MIEPIEPVQLVGPTTVAKDLGVNRQGAQHIIAAEVGGRAYEEERGGVLLARADLRTLTQWAIVEPQSPTLQVKVTPARWVDAEHRFVGWHRALPPEHQLDGVRQFWGIRDAEKLQGVTFLATVSSFVVYSAVIISADRLYGKARLDLQQQPDITEQWAEKRLPPAPGSTVTRYNLD